MSEIALPVFKPQTFTNAAAAVARVREIYDAQTSYLREGFQRLIDGGKIPRRVSANYPEVEISVARENLYGHGIDRRTSYGFVSREGTYNATLTRPDIFGNYYTQQFDRLISNHGIGVTVKTSDVPIPLHFAYPEGFHVEGDLTDEKRTKMQIAFDHPDIMRMQDTIETAERAFVTRSISYPLSFFTAPRIDASLHRLRHYSGTNPADFQNFVLYTNYDFYVKAFKDMALDILGGRGEKHRPIGGGQYTSFVQPGGHTTYHANTNLPPSGQHAKRIPQMPAYHLTREDGNGITLVNIGVGPTNAQNMSEHIAVLRPHAWIMVGHCAGLRDELKLGDFILAQSYEGIRNDGIATAEVMIALQKSVQELTARSEGDVREIMRTGTVFTTDNRNWEFDPSTYIPKINRTRAIGLDMESGMLASVGLRYAVPSGALLCVSDKPISGEMKLPGMAGKFYEMQTRVHMMAGIRAMELLRENTELLHSRKLSPLIRPFL